MTIRGLLAAVRAGARSPCPGSFWRRLRGARESSTTKLVDGARRLVGHDPVPVQFRHPSPSAAPP